MRLSTKSFHDMKANDYALKMYGLDFLISVWIFSCGGKYFDKKRISPARKNQTKIQNSNPYILSAESLAFMSRKDFVDKRFIGGDMRV